MTGGVVANSVSRRAALGALGVSAVAGAAGAGITLAVAPQKSTPAASSGVFTVADWVGSRGDRYLIAHRGSGDVLPEHSMEAYQAAVAWGAQCVEISVGMTADGVLICMHDASYDRTTTTTGKLSSLPSTVLRSVRINTPQLGPAWTAEPRPAVPLFEDVLRTFGGRVILAIEAKNGSAYAPMMDLVERYGLGQSVIVKAAHDSAHLVDARLAGYPVFGYLGAVADATRSSIVDLSSRLDPTRDYLVIPGPGNSQFLDDSLVRAAVATGVPVWVFPMHRRVDVAHYFGLGVVGAVCSSFGYLNLVAPSSTADTWAYGAVTPGELTKSPGTVSYAPTWSTDELTLGVQTAQHFLTLGQFCPVPTAAANYTIEFDAAWTTLPATDSDNLSLVFGHVDDRYYEHEAGFGDGYHAILRATGSLELFRHKDGVPVGTALAAAVPTPAPSAGQWMHFKLDVTPSSLSFGRTDVPGAVTTSTDTSNRGGYLHIGRSSVDGAVAFRKFTVSS